MYVEQSILADVLWYPYSEWLDRQAHKQRRYRIWVGVVAVLILAGIGGGCESLMSPLASGSY